MLASSIAFYVLGLFALLGALAAASRVSLRFEAARVAERTAEGHHLAAATAASRGELAVATLRAYERAPGPLLVQQIQNLTDSTLSDDHARAIAGWIRATEVAAP